ncbi:MAG: hypothetical protein ACYDBJ_00625 [Aggregatilineales bacterium]
MDTNTFLQELETLTHDQRMRRMVEVGKQARSDTSATEVAKALEHGGVYERRLALTSCFGSRDGEHVLRALADSSRTVRSLAITLVSLVCDDDQAQTALASLVPKSQKWLIRKLIDRKRKVPVDAHLSALAAQQAAQLPELLGYGSSELVARHLPAVFERVGRAAVRRLACYHPRLILETLRHYAETITQRDQRLIQLAKVVIPFTAPRHPVLTLLFVKALARYVLPTEFDLRELARHASNELVDFALNVADGVPIDLNLVARRLDMGQLIQWIERGYGYSVNLRWFTRLIPAHRAEMYAILARVWQNQDGIISIWLVGALPRDLREQEARRHLALPILATRPKERLPYTAFLPWEQAHAELTPYIGDPDPELRIAALSALTNTVRYQRAALPELLIMIHARRNEQDPVRRAMLSGLAALPPGIWRTEHLDTLGQIIRQALDAADLSVMTAQYVEVLVVALLPRHTQWSATWLATLVEERGRVSLYNLENRLSYQDVRRIAPVLLPVFETWARHEREVHLVSAAQSFGRRLSAFEGLLNLLERYMRETPHYHTALAILSLIAKHDSGRAISLIPALIQEDASWGTQAVVYLYLHHKRQDLLTPFLGQHAYRGRFSTGNTPVVPSFGNGFERWTPPQQAIFAESLRQVAGDTVRDTPAVIGTIQQLAGLMYVPPDRLITLANDKRQAVREYAVRALGRLDAGQGLPVLLEAMADDRARVAIYALRSMLLVMSAERALALLREVPLNKITVAKEVIRLIGELHTEAAYQELLAFNGRELHRDVYVALIRALWDYLEHPETWRVFEYAAQTTDPAIATIVGRTPADKLSENARQRLLTLLAGLISHANPRVRLDTLQRCVQLPISDANQIMLSPLREALETHFPDIVQAAANAIFATYPGQDSAIVGQIVERIRPNRQALWHFLNALRSKLKSGRSYLLESIRAVLNVLASDPATATRRVELALSALPWSEAADIVEQMAEVHELHADALSIAEYGINPSTRYLADIEQMEARFVTSTDRYVRRLALAALIAAASAYGWTDERLARLEIYRADVAPLIAEAAQFTFPPPAPATAEAASLPG